MREMKKKRQNIRGFLIFLSVLPIKDQKLREEERKRGVYNLLSSLSLLPTPK